MVARGGGPAGANQTFEKRTNWDVQRLQTSAGSEDVVSMEYAAHNSTSIDRSSIENFQINYPSKFDQKFSNWLSIKFFDRTLIDNWFERKMFDRTVIDN